MATFKSVYMVTNLIESRSLSMVKVYQQKTKRKRPCVEFHFKWTAISWLFWSEFLKPPNGYMVISVVKARLFGRLQCPYSWQHWLPCSYKQWRSVKRYNRSISQYFESEVMPYIINALYIFLHYFDFFKSISGGFRLKLFC